MNCKEGIVKWIDYEDILEKTMPYTAKYVLAHYLEAGRKTEYLYGGLATKDTVTFTVLEEF